VAGYHQPLSASSKPVLSARDLTGAPLISLVPCKNRKARPGPGPRKYFERQRHSSDQAAIPSSYYTGQNLYQKLLVDQGYPYLQDFYQNPTFANRSNHRQQQSVEDNSKFQHQLLNLRRDKLTSSKSSDNLSDAISVSSEEEENFKPRIIRPRRRRKKEKRRGGVGGLSVLEQDEASCLGSENQWLPTGLLSAESESREDSDTSDTDDEEGEEEGGKRSKSGKRRTHRKLGGTLSVPTFPSYQSRELSNQRTSIGSDYYSLTSSSSCSPASPQSSSSDQLCDSDNGISGHHPTLTASKSYNNSNSYFRSPKLTQKVESGGKSGVKSRQLVLRKTQSWAHDTSQQAVKLGEFSLFSPGKSIDLLSGIRKHLSRLDLNEEDSNEQ